MAEQLQNLIEKSHINRDKIDILQTHIYDPSLSWVGTGTSQKSDGIELVLWTTQTYPRSKNFRSLKWLLIHIYVMYYNYIVLF